MERIDEQLAENVHCRVGSSENRCPTQARLESCSLPRRQLRKFAAAGSVADNSEFTAA